MQLTSRTFVSPLAAVITLAIGIAVVAAMKTFLSLFSSPAVVTDVVKHDAPLIVRPHDNTDAIAPQKLELSCYDLNILPIWQALKKDSVFKERLQYSSGSLNCSEMLEVLRFDLNQDGKDEVIAQGKGLELCTPTGNCSFWVFELKKSGARTLLADYDFYPGLYPEFGEQVQKSRTKGYSDILLAGHSKSDETSYRTFKYDGEKYFESRCLYEIPKMDRQREGSWELVACRELDRRR